MTPTDARLIALTGRLDAATAPDIESQLLAALESGGHVVADLAGVTHLSSAGLAALLKAAKAAAGSGATLTLAAPNADILDALTAAGFPAILSIRDAA